MLVLLAFAGVVLITLADAKRDRYLLRVYSFDILCLMDSGLVRNM